MAVKGVLLARSPPQGSVSPHVPLFPAVRWHRLYLWRSPRFWWRNRIPPPLLQPLAPALPHRGVPFPSARLSVHFTMPVPSYHRAPALPFGARPGAPNLPVLPWCPCLSECFPPPWCSPSSPCSPLLLPATRALCPLVPLRCLPDHPIHGPGSASVPLAVRPSGPRQCSPVTPLALPKLPPAAPPGSLAGPLRCHPRPPRVPSRDRPSRWPPPHLSPWAPRAHGTPNPRSPRLSPGCPRPPPFPAPVPSPRLSPPPQSAAPRRGPGGGAWRVRGAREERPRCRCPPGTTGT